MSLPNGVLGWYAVCDCGISWSYSLTFEGQCANRTITIPHQNPLQSWSLKFFAHIPGGKNILEDAFAQLNEDIELTSCLLHILQLASTLCGLSNKS